MKTLRVYLEDCCNSASVSTPANTMGMGNPGEIAPDTLTEPIGGVEKTAKTLKQDERKKKKKKIKSLSESLFDDDLATRDMSKFGSIFKLDSVETKDSLYRPGHGRSGGQMVRMKNKPGDMYKIG